MADAGTDPARQPTRQSPTPAWGERTDNAHLLTSFDRHPPLRLAAQHENLRERLA